MRKFRVLTTCLSALALGAALTATPARAASPLAHPFSMPWGAAAHYVVIGAGALVLYDIVKKSTGADPLRLGGATSWRTQPAVAPAPARRPARKR